MPLSQTEYIARALLNHYLPRERFVYNVRPEWLKNPETGRNLELDIYCPDRGFAIEVDGVQHGRYIKGMQRDFRAFQKQQSRDMSKREMCKERGVTLYRLTIFDLTELRFASFLHRLSTAHGLKPDRFIESPNPLFVRAEMLSRAKVVSRQHRKPGLIPLLKRGIMGRR